MPERWRLHTCQSGGIYTHSFGGITHISGITPAARAERDLAARAWRGPPFPSTKGGAITHISGITRAARAKRDLAARAWRGPPFPSVRGGAITHITGITQAARAWRDLAARALRGPPFPFREGGGDYTQHRESTGCPSLAEPTKRQSRRRACGHKKRKSTEHLTEHHHTKKKTNTLHGLHSEESELQNRNLEDKNIHQDACRHRKEGQDSTFRTRRTSTSLMRASIVLADMITTTKKNKYIAYCICKANRICGCRF